MPATDPVLSSAGYLLLKAGHYMGQAFDGALAAVGLSSRELLVLSFVASSEGLPQQDLGDRLNLDPTIIVGLVDALEDRGLVQRRRDVADRRRNVITLTATGRRAYHRAVQAAASAEADFLRPLEAAEREELRHLLRRAVSPRLPWLDARTT
jgi:DNA-binding MarR family transcriptional regulator